MLPDFLQNNRRAFKRIAIVGIGNELNGDDAVGVLAARSLSRCLNEQGIAVDMKAVSGLQGQPVADSGGPALLVIDSGPAPEGFTGPLRRFQPDLVIMIDAAELGEPPGTIRWFDWEAAQGMSGSTHTLPPSMFARYLMTETGCQVLLIGVQPKHLNFDEGISPEARAAVDGLTGALHAWLVDAG